MIASESVPIFIVELAGKRLSASTKARIRGFELDEAEKRSAEVKVHLVLQASERHEDFLPRVGDKFRVQWGYVGAVEDTGEMRVHSASPRYGSTNEIEIVARDQGAELGREGGHRVWSGTQLGKIVEDLAGKAGLTVVLPRDPKGSIGGVPNQNEVPFDQAGSRSPAQVTAQAQTPAAPREAKLLKRVSSIAQSGRSPRAVLHDIAAAVGCELHVKGKELSLLPKHFAARPAVVLRWNHASGQLIELAPKERRHGKHEAGAHRTRATGVDHDTGKPFSEAAEQDNQQGRPVLGREAPSGGPQGDGSAAGGDVVVVDSRRHGEVVRRGLVNALAALGPAGEQAAKALAGAFLPTPSGRKNDAAARAGSKMRDAEAGGVRTTFKALGNPLIRKGRVLELRGLDPLHSGLWMVTSCRHGLGENYEVSGEVRRHGANKVGKGKARTTGQPNAAKGPASGQPAQQKPQVFYRVDSRRHGELVGAVVR